MKRKQAGKIKHLAVISDTHWGSSVALSQKHQLDDGAWYVPSKLQAKLYRHWMGYWEWAYKHFKDEPFAIVHVGDIVEGLHHRSTQIQSGNLSIQAKLAIDMMLPHVTMATKYFQIRGTAAHVGASAQEEETIAASLGAERETETGNYARWMLWLKFGGKLFNFAHHIGTTTSSAYESSALMRETVAAFTESGQHAMRPPDYIIRGHTHRYLKMDGAGGWTSIKLPAWQLKTEFVHRIDRMRGPQIGGLTFSAGDEGIYTRTWVHTIKEQKAVSI